MDDHQGSRRSRGTRPDPADVRQLADSPVSLRRIAALFAPHRATLAVVVALIVLSSVVWLAAIFTIVSGLQYLVQGMRYLSATDAAREDASENVFLR